MLSTQLKLFQYIYIFTKNRTREGRHASISSEDSNIYSEQQITSPIVLQIPPSPTNEFEIMNSDMAEFFPQTKASSYMPKNQLPKVNLKYCIYQ